MDDLEKLLAIEAIKVVKSRYFRGVDGGNGQLVRDILAQDCNLDYRGCFIDPATGHDFFPAMNIVIRGRDSWGNGGLSAMGIISVHQGHHCEIEITGDSTASAIWSMTDRLFMPPGSEFAQLRGFGYYHETYEKTDGQWKLKTLRLERIRTEGLPAAGEA